MPECKFLLLLIFFSIMNMEWKYVLYANYIKRSAEFYIVCDNKVKL